MLIFCSILDSLKAALTIYKNMIYSSVFKLKEAGNKRCPMHSDLIQSPKRQTVQNDTLDSKEYPSCLALKCLQPKQSCFQPVRFLQWELQIDFINWWLSAIDKIRIDGLGICLKLLQMSSLIKSHFSSITHLSLQTSLN